VYFERVLRRLDVPPERVFFIDDHDANVNAAIAAGLRAALFPAAGGAAHLGRLLAEQGVTPVQV
jgi:FMN phosphatase YigB (HAD superfamily)